LHLHCRPKTSLSNLTMLVLGSSDYVRAPTVVGRPIRATYTILHEQATAAHPDLGHSATASGAPHLSASPPPSASVDSRGQAPAVRGWLRARRAGDPSAAARRGADCKQRAASRSSWMSRSAAYMEVEAPPAAVAGGHFHSSASR